MDVSGKREERWGSLPWRPDRRDLQIQVKSHIIAIILKKQKEKEEK